MLKLYFHPKVKGPEDRSLANLASEVRAELISFIDEESNFDFIKISSIIFFYSLIRYGSLAKDNLLKSQYLQIIFQN